MSAGLLLIALASCAPAPEAPPVTPRLVLRWDPSTGRGDVVHHLGGARMRTCFQCEYEGYTGGLVVGNQSGSGMGIYPREPIRGFSEINLFCAQDESIHDLDSGEEYTTGWSENMGEGADGQRLEYVRGQVAVPGPDELVLLSRNAGGCYRVDKAATTRADTPWWVIATRITNRCEHPVRFHLYSGDDPWLGRYASSEGDVGWTPAGLVRHEAALGVGEFTTGGLYDLGNSSVDGVEGSFSNEASFVALDPVAPPPDHAIFANAFAHESAEIDPDRPLDHHSLTALNLVWRDQVLEPGASFTWAMALGRAHTGEPGEVPTTPDLTDADWSAWRTWLTDEAAPGPEALEFAAERVELDLRAGQLAVDATYTVRNRSSAAMATTIRYPILVAEDRPAPPMVEIDGVSLAPSPDEGNTASVEIALEVPPRSIRRFRARYVQPHTENTAAYLVTTARTWPAPIDSAVFVVRHPASLGEVELSLPVDHRRQEGGEVVLTVVEEGFWPVEEVVMRW